MRMQVWVKTGVKRFAIAAFFGYVAWNVVWLARGRIPPSIWTYCTSLPCPTTGVCRSLSTLCRGDICAAFMWNAFTFPYLCLIGLSAAVLLKQYLGKQELRLPPLLANAWWLTLSLGWAAKFLLGREYW
jgi:hypothetical protein